MKKAKNSVGAVILAAGTGSRMGAGITKQKMNISGMSVIKRCVIPFIRSEYICEILIVCREDEIDFARSELAEFKEKPISFVVGGNTRQDSARIGFNSVFEQCELVAIHDGARCLVSEKNINDVCAAAIKYGAATASTPVTDTVKQTKDGFAVATVKRENLAAVQTPQVFKCDIYKRALECAGGASVTDDNMLVESLGIGVRLVDTGKKNIKLTTQEDVEFAEFLISGGYLNG